MPAVEESLGFVADEDFGFVPDTEPDFGFVPDEQTAVETPSLRTVIPAPTQGTVPRGTFPAGPTPEETQKVRMLEAQKLQDRFRIALELTRDPAKQDRLREDYAKQLERIGVGSINMPGLVQAATSPLASVPKVSGRDMEILFPGSKTAQVVAGAQRVAAGAVEGLSMPIGLATAIPGLPGVAKHLVSGGFAAQMGSHVPELARTAGETSVTGDIGEKTEAYGNLITTSIFAGTAGAHAMGVGPSGPGPATPEQLRAEKVAGWAGKTMLQQIEGAELVGGESSRVRTFDEVPAARAPEDFYSVAVQRAEQVAPATAQALRDLTGQPGAKLEAAKKGEKTDEKSIDEKREENRRQEEDQSQQGKDVETEHGPAVTPEPEGAGISVAPASPSRAANIQPQPISAAEIATKPDLMQFKRMDDRTSGTNEGDTLAGEWDSLKAGNLLLWEPIDPAAHGLAPGQKYIVANGHHRVEFGKERGVDSFSAQIIRESDGFSAEDARTVGAELNIADGKGTIYDQAKFIRNEARAHGENAALERARSIGARGRKAATIGLSASDNLFDSFINERISPDQAEVIARAAPRDEALQQVGIDLALRGQQGAELANTLQAVRANRSTPSSSQGDLFGSDDTALNQARSMAAEASRRQKELSDQISAIQGAAKRPEQAAKGGVNVTNPAEALQTVERLKAERAKWESWAMHPELVAQVRGKIFTAEKAPELRAGENQGDLLSTQSEDIALVGEKGTDNARVEQEKVQAEKVAAEAKAQADKEQGSLFGDTVKATKPLNELIEESSKPKLGIIPGAPRAPELPPVRVPREVLRSESPAVEARWQNAHGIGERTIFEKLKAVRAEIVHAFTRHFPKLDPAVDGQAMDILRQFEATPNFAKEMAGQTMRGFTAGFKRDHLNVFERVVILRDLAEDVASGRYAGKEIPLGYESEAQIRADLSKFERIAAENPGIASGLERRTELWNSLRERMIEADILPPSVRDRADYFHRQILQYMRLKDEATTGTTSSDVRTHGKGFQKKRAFSSKDYNTSYLEAEFEVLSQAFAQLNTIETVAKLDKAANIRKRMDEAEQSARDAGDTEATWRDFIPADHTTWQPERGNVLYWVNSLADRVIQKILAGEKIFEESDLHKVLAVGGKRNEWVIPKRLAETLDDYKARRDDNVVERWSALGQYGWKKLTLFSPPHVLKYELNNFSGDLDIVMAFRAGITKHIKQAAFDAWDYRVRQKAPTEEQLNLIKKGVVGSGFFTEELGGISKNQLFAAMHKPNANVIRKYFNTVEKYNAWREDVLRMAAYRYTKQRLEAGEKLYGASEKAEVDAIPGLDDKAAKIARELIGDYGNVSRAGQWLRRHMIPFYSWLEINAPRYVRLFKNVKHETEGATGPITRVAARKAVWAGTKFVAGAAGMQALVQLWNHTMFPDEEKELNRDRKQLHLILGRDENGDIRSIRFQGALSDAMSWFGAEDLPADIADLASGKKSFGELWGEATMAPINKIINSSVPGSKTLIEAFTGKSSFPEPIKVQQGKDGQIEFKRAPRTVRDPVEHIARLYSVDILYRWMAKIPTPGFRANLAKLVTYTTNPGESAYFAAREIVADYNAKQGKEFSGTAPTKKGNALFYHKQAIKYKDDKLAEHWKAKYLELGGTTRGMKQSIDRISPLSGIAAADRRKFLEQLGSDDAEIVAKGTQWFERTYKGK